MYFAIVNVTMIGTTIAKYLKSNLVHVSVSHVSRYNTTIDQQK